MKLIELSKGQYAKVSDIDFDFLNQWSWYACFYPKRGKYTANRRFFDKKLDKRVTLYMHRLILNAPEGLDVDHKNHDPLDNQRENLRLATRSQNNANARAYNGRKYRGIYWNPVVKRWYAQIRHLRKSYYIGCYRNPEDAARAYNKVAIEKFGEFIMLNEVT